MDQILPQNWAYLHLGLIFSITFAQMLVVYVLSDSSTPPAGLGLFTVYFMAALLGWIALTLQQGSSTLLVVNVPSVAAIINSYILFLAAGQRAQLHQGRINLGCICLVACLSVFFVGTRTMFAVHTLSSALFFLATALTCAIRATTQRNVGDAIIACASLLMVGGMPVAVFQYLAQENIAQAHSTALGVYSCAYVMVAVGFLASVLIEYQQHLSHLATQDPLTRLLNRRGLNDALHVSVAHASRQGLPMAAIVLDIDHFKRVNDSFGHDTGDQVIRLVGDILSRMSRASDVVARTGGEEFLLVLQDTGLDAARTIAERIRLAIGEHPLLVDEQHIPVTVSLGVSGAAGEVNLDKLIQEADRAMYLAKQGGRNQVASVENNPVHLSSRTGEI